jgi:hypothetical protein
MASWVVKKRRKRKLGRTARHTYLFHGLTQEYAWYSNSGDGTHGLIGGVVKMARFDTKKKALDAAMLNAKDVERFDFIAIRV